MKPSLSHPDSMDEISTNKILQSATPPVTRNIYGTSSIGETQIMRTYEADPNSGRCLVTNSSTGVELTKLEYAWGMGYRELNINSHYNLIFLSKDWHTHLDHGRFLLVPELDVLQHLHDIYWEGNVPKFQSTKTFKYQLVSFHGLKDPIHHFANPESNSHETHLYPYDTLGVLTSHAHPHFVICSTGAHLKSVKYPECLRDDLRFITRLYRIWTNDSQESHSNDSDSDCSIDSTSIAEDECTHSKDSMWAKEIFNWQKECKVASDLAGGWDTITSIDEQLKAYADEQAHTPLPLHAWNKWKPLWASNPNKIHDTANFSSNDWAVYETDIFLPRLHGHAR
ncbi:hypothetical protein BU15DRAFT_61955 [Melanogaster broomeanus]|nr:hypothetical protein BU15DRAFT_61955 [Melanogaster broomeanus]